MFKKDKKAERTPQTLTMAELDKLAGGFDEGYIPRTGGRGDVCQTCASRLGEA